MVFKWLWPGSWITGKLSDLAWVIFASPLLALPLTFLARRNPTAQRAAWAIAYIGLPLLYAAYNTFEPVHDIVMGVFAFLRGTPGGSSFDPTDSIVIPFGVAIAIWVWKNTKVDSAATKARLGLIVAIVASMASVATSYEGPYAGVTKVHLDDEGKLVYETGGWNYRDQNAMRSVVTPRGEYSIDGTNVYLTHEGSKRAVFSTVIKSERRDRIALLASTRNLDGRTISIAPYSIFYDERTDNVILALGLQGIIIGTPDGRWERTPVGELKPLDYSISSRIS